jgi:hypothetical protein
MNLVKKLFHSAKFLVIILILSISLFAPAAIAAMGMPAIDSLFKSVLIKDGKFSFSKNNINVPSDIRIGKAIVSLPPGETGKIDEISIVGPNGKIFGCKNIKIENGINLIKACGGPAYSKAGNTTYQASGSNFQPKSSVKFGIELSQ